MQQWSELNSLSFDTLNNLVNNGMEKRHLVESDLGVLSGVGGVAKRLEAKVVAERERFFVELKRTLGKMVGLLVVCIAGSDWCLKMLDSCCMIAQHQLV